MLCNNAGVVKRARSWELTVDDWRWVLGVDLWSVIHAVRAFVPRMLEQAEGGHIVNTASMSGLLPIPNLAAYSVAKSAVVALSEALQLDLDAEGASIGVSVLCPGSSPPASPRASATGRPSCTDAAPMPGRGPHDGRVSSRRWTPPRSPATSSTRSATNRFWILTHDAYREVIQAARRRRSGRTPARRRHRSGDGSDGRRQVPASRDTTGAIGTIAVGLEQDVADPPALAHRLHVLGDLLDAADLEERRVEHDVGGQPERRGELLGDLLRAGR